MYLTIMHPEILSLLKDVGVGVFVARIRGKYLLVVKASKEIILTAKANKGFHFYLAPIEVDSKKTLVLMTAFFDSEDEPLIIGTPLLENDVATIYFLEFLRSDAFEVFFFDEHNRELLSYKASGNLTAMRDRIVSVTLLNADAVKQMLDKAEIWFGLRNERDDEDAVSVTLTEPLFPDDFVVMDLEYEKHRFKGTQSFSFTSLERKEPGAYQELDIVFLLQRVYEANRIFLNPKKAVDDEELVDVMVIGNEAVLLIQAKDSPNTEKILRTTVRRKRIKSLSQLKEGASQLRGAISEIKRNSLVRLKYGDEIVEVDLSGKQLIGVVVVKELFNDSFDEYGSVIFDLIKKTQTPVVFFDYPELNMMALHCNAEDKFLNVMHQIFSIAMEDGEFPRVRYSGRPNK